MKHKPNELYVVINALRGRVYYNPYHPDRPGDPKTAGPLTIYRQESHARDAANYLKESIGGDITFIDLESLQDHYRGEWSMLTTAMVHKLGGRLLDKFPPPKPRSKCFVGDLFTVHRVSLGFKTHVSVRYKNMVHFETNADRDRMEQIREIYKTKLPGVHTVCLTYSEQPCYLNPDDRPDTGEY